MLSIFAALGGVNPAKAATGINQQINYQGRLLDSTGAVVADGTYNMELKIYQDGTGCVGGGSSPCGGTLKWTETRTGANKVTVRNGYFSIQLGEVTAFGSNVDWNQGVLWLSINIGGTGSSPTWDNEMLPFKRLGADAYALNAGSLNGLDATHFLQVAAGATQADASLVDSVSLNKTGASGNIMDLQKNGNSVLKVSNSGQVGIGATTGTSILDVGANDTQTTVPIALLEQAGTGDAAIGFKTPSQTYMLGIDQSNSNALSVIVPGGSGGTPTNFGMTSTSGGAADSGCETQLTGTKFQTGTSGGALTSISAYISTVDAGANLGQVAIYTDAGSTPSTLIASSASTTLTAGWTTFPVSATLSPNTYYWLIYQTNTTTANRNELYAIWDGTGASVSVARGTYGTWPGTWTAGGAYAGTYVLYGTYTVGGGTDSTIFSLSGTGQAKFQNSSDSLVAFQIQNAGNSPMLSVDTNNNLVIIGTSDTTGVLLVLDNKTDATDPATNQEGAMYYNASTKSFRCYMNGRWRSCVGGAVAANTSVPAGNTVANTASETNFASNYSIPANDCQPGRVFRLTAQGVYSATSSTPTLQIKVYAGTTQLAATGATSTGASALTNREWRVEFQIICDTTGASGTVEAAGVFTRFTSATANAMWEMSNTGTITLNTTAAQTLQISAKWGTASASNTITMRQFIVEESGP